MEIDMCELPRYSRMLCRESALDARRSWLTRVFALLWLVSLASACATVRPEQRAVLADPVMQFESEPGEQAARQRVLENREGALGGGSIKGGGCGCN
jgi:hypothetical protein